jgi:UDP-glucose 4-epimerase
MRAIVTGAAGFIGSHLLERLLSDGHQVVGIDNLSSGSLDNLPQNRNFEFVKMDIRDYARVLQTIQGAEVIFHLAADPLVKESAERPLESFEINVRGTVNLLEAARKVGVNGFLFTSTSAVYGDAKILPTPETHPLAPISNYAASKIAAESYISSYSSTYGIRATVLRFANIFGPRSAHGVMHDFFFKLKKNPRELEILGNGKQSKSYLFVSDCVQAALLAQKKQKETFDIFNIGSDAAATVDELADDICSIMKLSPKRKYTGGRRGWVGDVAKMRLETRKIKRTTGWKPKVTLKKGISTYLNWLSKVRN